MVRHLAAAVLVTLCQGGTVWGQSQQPADHARTKTFNRALGVECAHCHVQNQWSDESKPAFATARNMMRMVEVVNDTLKGVGRISCISCHGQPPRPSRQPRAALDEYLARWPAELSDAPEIQRIVMASYSIALGVTCEHCHSKDWKALDKGPIRKVALMNSLFKEFPKYMPATARTQCYMCHKGSTRPRRR